MNIEGLFGWLFLRKVEKAKEQIRCKIQVYRKSNVPKCLLSSGFPWLLMFGKSIDGYIGHVGQNPRITFDRYLGGLCVIYAYERLERSPAVKT